MVKHLWNCKAEVYCACTIVIAAHGAVRERFHLYLKKAGLEGSMKPLQKACLQGKVRIIRKVMDT